MTPDDSLSRWIDDLRDQLGHGALAELPPIELGHGTRRLTGETTVRIMLEDLADLDDSAGSWAGMPPGAMSDDMGCSATSAGSARCSAGVGARTEPPGRRGIRRARRTELTGRVPRLLTRIFSTQPASETANPLGQHDESDEDAEHPGTYKLAGAPRHHTARHGCDYDQKLYAGHRRPPSAYASGVPTGRSPHDREPGRLTTATKRATRAPAGWGVRRSLRRLWGCERSLSAASARMTPAPSRGAQRTAHKSLEASAC